MTLWNLEVHLPNEIHKPACHVTFRDAQISEVERRIPERIEKIGEEDFYQPFSDLLFNELEECTKAIALGGNKFKDKWGTPDVFGNREPLKSDINKPLYVVVSSEIKTDTRDLIAAFGQAYSYKLFSHRSYIVVRKESPEEDITRIDSYP